MNISPDGVTVRFDIESEELFEAEKSGAKSNIVQILDEYELKQLEECAPKKIIIQHQQEIFLRTLTHIHVTTNFFGKHIVVFSWTNERHHHKIPHNIELNTKAHTMSLDELSPILLPKVLIQDLGRHRGNRSHAEFISDLLDDHKMYFYPITGQLPSAPGPHSVSTQLGNHNLRPEEAMSPAEESSPDKTFAAITVSKGTLALLQSIAHGQTLNMVIKELYEVYIYQRHRET